MPAGLLYREALSTYAPPPSDEYRELDRDELALLMHSDLDELGRLADRLRRERVGENVYYNANRHIEPTNICRLGCTFCSFAKQEMSEDGAFRYTVEEILARTEGDEERGITEFHIVGGVDSALNVDYYTKLIHALHDAHPTIEIKSLSAVEIGALAMRHRTTYEDVLTRFRDAGSSAITGGGAEIFAPRVRKVIAGNKINGREWLAVHEAAHRVGLHSNATILYGHYESYEERVDHILAIRELQSKTGGFRAFIPLPFVPQKGTPMENEPSPGGEEFLRTMAISRIALHNFHTIKAYWPAAGLDWAKRSLHFGANDLDGTITEETIYHTYESSLTRQQLEEIIRAEGREPVQR